MVEGNKIVYEDDNWTVWINPDFKGRKIIRVNARKKNMKLVYLSRHKDIGEHVHQVAEAILETTED